MRNWLKHLLPESITVVIDEVTFENDTTLLIKCDEAKSGVYTVPITTLYIERKAFKGCTKLSCIALPQGLLSIGEYAFKDCSKLSSINIPPKIHYLHKGVLEGCKSLEEIHAQSPTPPQCVNHQWRFFDDEMNLINKFKPNYFSDSSCLNSVDKAKCKLYVPKGSYDSYSKADIWKEFHHIIEDEYFMEKKQKT